MAILEQFFGATRPAERMACRVALEPGQITRLPNGGTIEVLDGRVWVSLAGEDLELMPGMTLFIPPGKNVALASSLGRGWAMLSVIWPTQKGGTR